jgi:hypothetical protein
MNRMKNLFEMPLDPYTKRCMLGKGNRQESLICSCNAKPLVCLPVMPSAEQKTMLNESRLY